MSARPFSFENPLKDELEHLLSTLGDLRRAKQALGYLHSSPGLFREGGAIASALYTQALVSYVRCFTSGRRKGLDASIFDGHPKLAERHKEVKGIRDRHIAHPVSELERWDVLVAAESETSGVVGLGVHNWFFVGGAQADIKAFLQLIAFVDKKVSVKLTAVGNALAKELMGSKATWRTAQKSFWEHITHEQVYGPTKIDE